MALKSNKCTILDIKRQLYHKGGVEEENNSRVSSAGRLFNAIKTGFLNRKEVSKKPCFQYMPTLTYSSESWTLTEKL